MSTLLDIKALIAHNAAVPENAYSIPELNACIIDNGDGTGSLQIAGTIAPGSGDASAANQVTQIAQIAGALDGTTPLYVSDATAEDYLQSIKDTNINIDTNVQLSINQGLALGQPVGTLATVDANAALELANLNLSNTEIQNNTTSINNSILDSFQLAVSNGQPAYTLSVFDKENETTANIIATNTANTATNTTTINTTVKSGIVRAQFVNGGTSFTLPANSCILYALDDTTRLRSTNYSTTTTTPLESSLQLMTIAEILNFSKSTFREITNMITVGSRSFISPGPTNLQVFILTVS